ncbi:AAA family ATPase [Consotaella aegiceratis]|uniref:AAA family ATPase n=1 Tax=Consotaella aegiceratis TaxID=3097961 RepID=UPI002F415CB1
MPDRLAPRIINPDDFLLTPHGRLWSVERNKAAWRRCHETLQHKLLNDHQVQTVVIVCGLQGAGKSSWIAQQPEQANVIYFDAALPGARHRQPIVDIARAAEAVVEAVWIKVPLAVALERSSARQQDLRVPEDSIRSVARLFEPPTLEEGFDRVRIVDGATLVVGRQD